MRSDLPQEIDEFMQKIQKMKTNLPEKKTTTVSPKSKREHNHFPQGKTGYKSGSTSDPVRLK